MLEMYGAPICQLTWLIQESHDKEKIEQAQSLLRKCLDDLLDIREGTYGKKLDPFEEYMKQRTAQSTIFTPEDVRWKAKKRVEEKRRLRSNIRIYLRTR